MDYENVQLEIAISAAENDKYTICIERLEIKTKIGGKTFECVAVRRNAELLKWFHGH